MALNARVAQRCILIPAEGEYRLVHLLRVENLKPHQQVEILHRQACDRLKQSRFDLGDHILQCVLPEIAQIHERRDFRGELDQLLLHLLAFGFVFLLLVRELLLLLGGQVPFLGLLLEILDLLALVDDRFDHIVAELTPVFDAPHGGHRLRVVEDAAECVVIHIHQQRALPFAGEQIRSRTGHSPIQDSSGVDRHHVRAVVGKDGQEGNEIPHRVFRIRLVGCQADPVLGELPQGAGGREIEHEADRLEDFLLVRIVAVRVLDRPRRLHPECRLEIGFRRFQVAKHQDGRPLGNGYSGGELAAG